jgi:tetratricopeptide (TPR) repeat protein
MPEAQGSRRTERNLLHYILFWTALLAASLTGPANAQADDAQALQERAKGRVDRYLHHFRRTFDQNELRPEILQAKSELQRSVELFRAAGARADAARSLVKLGDVRRYLNEWDSAILTYEEAAAEARAAGAALVECKAFIGDARAHLIGKKSSGRAMELVQQAIPLAQRANEAGGLFDVWDLLAQVQRNGSVGMDWPRRPRGSSSVSRCVSR